MEAKAAYRKRSKLYRTLLADLNSLFSLLKDCHLHPILTTFSMNPSSTYVFKALFRCDQIILSLQWRIAAFISRTRLKIVDFLGFEFCQIASWVDVNRKMSVLQREDGCSRVLSGVTGRYASALHCLLRLAMSTPCPWCVPIQRYATPQYLSHCQQ